MNGSDSGKADRAAKCRAETGAMRLNRYLSASGAASRRSGETIIRDGRVTVNGEIVSDPARQVRPGEDRVSLDGVPLVIGRLKRYFMLNKPMGVIVSAGDPFGRPTVFDLLGEGTEGVFSVGRLDADTSGVLILTDDGDLAHRLMHPSFGVEKLYRAEVDGMVSREDVQAVRRGLELEDGPTAPAEMRVLECGKNGSVVEITLHQGRKRQVRRMLKALGHPVRALERVAFGGLTARDLPLGACRALDDSEIDLLKKAVCHKSGKGRK